MNKEDNILETFRGFARHIGEFLAGNPDLFTCYEDEYVDEYEDECKEGDENVVRRFIIDMKDSESLISPALIFNTETGNIRLVRTHYANPDHVIYEATSWITFNFDVITHEFISDMGEWFKIEIEKLKLKRQLLELNRKQRRIFEEQFGWY